MADVPIFVVGTATLVNGTVTVNNPGLRRTSSQILLAHKAGSGTRGTLSTGTRVAGTSFVIGSTSALDQNEVDYLIINT